MVGPSAYHDGHVMMGLLGRRSKCPIKVHFPRCLTIDRPGRAPRPYRVAMRCIAAILQSLWQVANVVGTLCENNDWFAKERSLPQTAAAGEASAVLRALICAPVR